MQLFIYCIFLVICAITRLQRNLLLRFVLIKTDNYELSDKKYQIVILFPVCEIFLLSISSPRNNSSYLHVSTEIIRIIICVNSHTRNQFVYHYHKDCWVLLLTYLHLHITHRQYNLKLTRVEMKTKGYTRN